MLTTHNSFKQHLCASRFLSWLCSLARDSVCEEGQCLFVGSVLTLIADNARPPVGAIAAIFPQIAFSSIRTVVACQTAVAAESVIQAHWKHKNQL